jgi:hypothetical protein
MAAAGYPPRRDLPSAAGETAGDAPRGLTAGFVSTWTTRPGLARTGPIDAGPPATARSAGTERIEPPAAADRVRGDPLANHAPLRDPCAPTRAGSASFWVVVGFGEDCRRIGQMERSGIRGWQRLASRERGHSCMAGFASTLPACPHFMNPAGHGAAGRAGSDGARTQPDHRVRQARCSHGVLRRSQSHGASWKPGWATPRPMAPAPAGVPFGLACGSGSPAALIAMAALTRGGYARTCQGRLWKRMVH